MKEFNAEIHPMVKTAGVSVGKIDYNNRYYPAYIGLDVHKETIAWAIAFDGRSQAEYGGEIVGAK